MPKNQIGDLQEISIQYIQSKALGNILGGLINKNSLVKDLLIAQPHSKVLYNENFHITINNINS